MNESPPASSPVDPLPERLIRAGCLLLIIPCLLVAAALIFYGWPFVVWVLMGMP